MSVASVRRLGRYALHRQIAAGGMASVHLGRLMGPAGFSRTVAIKRLHPQFAQDAHFVAMFLDEARVTGRIVHPNIVSTIDVVQERGELFIVMDFVQGAALSTLFQASVTRTQPIAIDVAAGIVMGALAGLHAAHEATAEGRRPLQVVHRDVSPHNVLVGTDGLARIADFGIAKAVGRMQSTAEGQLKGKLTYMAPEVIRGEDVDRRVDIYAAAIVFWELLTGRKLFSGNEASVLYEALEGTVEAPSVHRPDLPPGLDAVILKGLAKDRDERWRTAAEMSEAIEEVVSPAPARRIGAWVTELAATDLDLRAGLLEELERTTDAPPLSSNATPPHPAGASPRSEHELAPPDAVVGAPSAPEHTPEDVGDDVLASQPSDDAEEAAPVALRSRASRRTGVTVAVVGLGVGAALALIAFLTRNPTASDAGASPAATGSTIPAASVMAKAQAPTDTATRPIDQATEGSPPAISAPAVSASSPRSPSAPSTVRAASGGSTAVPAPTSLPTLPPVEAPVL